MNEYTIGQIFEDTYPPEAAQWCNENRAYIEEIAPQNDVRRFQIVGIPEPTFEEQVEAAYQAFDSYVEKRLNDFAATRRYASIYTACNARDLQIEKYAAEGAYCFKMWGETYAKCEELVAEYMPEVLAGKRPIPTWKEIEAQLPPLVWPDEQAEAEAE
jgi:hypothetical protein